jgi:hypothetical protein
MVPHDAQVEEPAIRELQRVYGMRFRESQEYRCQVWKILIRDFFQPLIPSSSHVLDLGCGRCSPEIRNGSESRIAPKTCAKCTLHRTGLQRQMATWRPQP